MNKKGLLRVLSGREHNIWLVGFDPIKLTKPDSQTPRKRVTAQEKKRKTKTITS
jgi:hypothetical protein